jgi:hypothetical protein
MKLLLAWVYLLLVVLIIGGTLWFAADAQREVSYALNEMWEMAEILILMLSPFMYASIKEVIHEQRKANQAKAPRRNYEPITE